MKYDPVENLYRERRLYLPKGLRKHFRSFLLYTPSIIGLTIGYEAFQDAIRGLPYLGVLIPGYAVGAANVAVATRKQNFLTKLAHAVNGVILQDALSLLTDVVRRTGVLGNPYPTPNWWANEFPFIGKFIGDANQYFGNVPNGYLIGYGAIAAYATAKILRDKSKFNRQRRKLAFEYLLNKDEGFRNEVRSAINDMKNSAIMKEISRLENDTGNDPRNKTKRRLDKTCDELDT